MGSAIATVIFGIFLIGVCIYLFGAMAAFALAEYRFKGNTLMGLYLALGIMIPIRIGTVAILDLMVSTGLVNTLMALILVYTAHGLPLAVVILSEFMRQVSDDLKNAGRIDGLSEYTIFFRLVLPLVRPSLATVAVFNMIPIWNQLAAPDCRGTSVGRAYVFRMNLNQQSSGATWETHKALMETTSPIVDCGVHYVDVMCPITDATPVRVNGMGLRLSNEIASDMYNYGQFQVVFEDGSAGCYEGGWGPMMSETAFFVKDVISPNGSMSIIESDKSGSDDVDGHAAVRGLLVHGLGGDELIALPDEPGHQELCDAEQAYVLRAISENIDLTRHMSDAVQSLAICLAADESIRTGRQSAASRWCFSLMRFIRI